MADFTINDDQFQQVIAQHILESIGPETRDRLITEALSFLTKEQDGYPSYGRKNPSPLALAFRQEVVKIGQEVVSRIVSEQEIKRHIEKSIDTMIRNWVKSKDYSLPGIIGDAIKANVELSIKDD